MATIGDLLIKLGIQDEASAGLQKFGTEAEAAGGKAKSFGGVVGETSEGVVKSLGKMAAFMGITGAAFEGAAFVKGGIEAAESLQKSQESLDTSIEKTGGSVQKLGPEFQSVAKAQADFGISQQSANQGLAEATLMSGSAEKGLRAYQEAVVLSKGAHIGLDAAIRATSKAQEGVTSGLTRYGIVMKPGLSSTQQLAAVMKVWGGQAQANTLDSDRLSAKFANLQAALGTALLPTFMKAADELGRFIDWLQLAAQWVQKNWNYIAPFAAAIGAVVAAYTAWRIVTGIWTATTELATAAQEGLNAAMEANPVGLVILALVALGAALVVLWTKSQTFRDIVLGVWGAIKTAITVTVGTVVSAVSGAWDKVKSVTTTVWDTVKSFLVKWWPELVGALAGPIGVLVALIVTHWGTIKSDASTAWGEIKSAVMTPVNAIKSGVDTVFGALAGAVKAAIGGVKAGISALSAVFSPLLSILHGIETAADAAAGAVEKVANVAGKVKSGVGGLLSHIPGFASGTPAFGGGVALVGENGPELVNLPNGASVLDNDASRRALAAHGQSGPLIGEVHVNNDVDIEVLAQRVARKLAFQTG